MQRLIPLTLTSLYDNPYNGDALVEFIRYNEDGAIVNEVVHIFLPEYVRPSDCTYLKKEINRLFHDGEGYNL